MCLYSYLLLALYRLPLLDTTMAIENNKDMLLRRVGQAIGVLSALTFLLVVADKAAAQQSTNYRFDESSIGTSSLIDSSSTNFQSRSGAGDLGVGNAASENYQVEAGSQTDPDPVLAFSLDDADGEFGAFSATSATTATTTFSVTNYTSYGYVVQIEGTPPANGSHVIDALPTNTASQVGVEQFGINMVANTLPSSVGANPDNGDFGFGEADEDYDTVNQYRYVSGEIIARAPKSSGKTVYTISYLINVEPLTPGGQYRSNQTVVVTGTY